MASRPDISSALRQRLLSASYLGLIRQGERLPSIRELAREFGVDNRTVLAAYRTLEREGVVELRARSGIFFGSALEGSSAAALSHEGRWALEVLSSGVGRGTPVVAVPATLARYFSTVQLRGACIECNVDQIGALTTELAGDFGFDVTGYDIDALLASPDSAPELAESDLIITTRFHAGEVQELAERARVPWLVISYRADVFAEIARLLPLMAVYFVLTDDRFAAKLKKIYADAPGVENLHLIVERRDDIDAIPPDAPTYVSRTAREQLAGHPILERVVPERRVFSADSSRELVNFLVRMNSAALATDRDRLTSAP